MTRKPPGLCDADWDFTWRIVKDWGRPDVVPTGGATSSYGPWARRWVLAGFDEGDLETMRAHRERVCHGSGPGPEHHGPAAVWRNGCFVVVDSAS